MILHPLRVDHQHINGLALCRVCRTRTTAQRFRLAARALRTPSAGRPHRQRRPRPLGQGGGKAHRLARQAVVAATRQLRHVLLRHKHVPSPLRPQGVEPRRRVELPAHDARGVPKQREVPAALQRPGKEPRAALQRPGAPHPRPHLDIPEQVHHQRRRPGYGPEDGIAVHPRHPPPHHQRIRRQLHPLLRTHRHPASPKHPFASRRHGNRAQRHPKHQQGATPRHRPPRHRQRQQPPNSPHDAPHLTPQSNFPAPPLTAARDRSLRQTYQGCRERATRAHHQASAPGHSVSALRRELPELGVQRTLPCASPKGATSLSQAAKLSGLLGELRG